MRENFWFYGSEYDEDGEGGAVAVVESSVEENRWRMTGIIVTSYYSTASSDYDGVVQLEADIRSRHVYRRRDKLKAREGIEQVESETYNSCEDADAAARQWLDGYASRPR